MKKKKAKKKAKKKTKKTKKKVAKKKVTKKKAKKKATKKSKKKKKKMIRLSYGDGETGWAEDLGDGRVKLDNCPLDTRLRAGDICTTVKGLDPDYPDWLTVGEVLEREFPHTAVIQYTQDSHWYLMRGGALIAGWRSEGGVAAEDDKPGFCSINYKGQQDDLEKFLDKLHIKDEVTIKRYSEK